MRGGGRTCTPARFGSAGGLYGGDGIRVTVRRARARSISRAAVWRAGMDGANRLARHLHIRRESLESCR